MDTTAKDLRPYTDLRLEQLEREFAKEKRIQKMRRELEQLEKELINASHDTFLDWERVSNTIDTMAHEYFYMQGFGDCRRLFNEVLFNKSK